MNLKGTLRSGLEYQIENDFDWYVFSEIFVNLEYRDAVDVNEWRGQTIVDLGANVGYATLFFADKLLIGHAHPDWHIYAIDGSTTNCETMLRRFRAQPQPLLVGHVTVHNALIGPRSGSAQFFENGNHVTNHVRNDGAWIYHNREALDKVPPTPFTDLTTLIPPGQIDILKVDIEGQEENFVDAYPDVLARTNTLIAEIHHPIVDPEVFRGKLYDAGFNEGYVCRAEGLVSVECFYR